MTTRIVFLNGSPSAGKSTLARAVHAGLPEPTFYQSLDEFRGSIRDAFWQRGRISDLFDRVLGAWLVCLREVALRGFPVVAESIILPADLPRYCELFGEFEVVLIGVSCPLPVARERDLLRTDRLNGPHELDVAEFSEVRQHDYELQVDTSRETTAESVARILTHLAERPVGLSSPGFLSCRLG
jgi:chloramphenicol 3-O phosphotransferase